MEYLPPVYSIPLHKEHLYKKSEKKDEHNEDNKDYIFLLYYDI